MAQQAPDNRFPEALRDLRADLRERRDEAARYEVGRDDERPGYALYDDGERLYGNFATQHQARAYRRGFIDALDAVSAADIPEIGAALNSLHGTTARQSVTRYEDDDGEFSGFELSNAATARGFVTAREAAAYREGFGQGLDSARCEAVGVLVVMENVDPATPVRHST